MKGGEAVHNAEALRRVLDGIPSAFADSALMTAGAALIVAGKSDDIKSAVTQARDAVMSGSAKKVFQRLVEVSNS